MASTMKTMMTRLTKRVLVAFLATVVAVMATRPFGGNVVHFQQDTKTRLAVQKHFKPDHPERGYVGNCKGGFYNVSWEPKDIGPSDRVHIYGNLVSPAFLNEVHLVGVLMYEGTHMLTINQRSTCKDFGLQLMGLFPRDVLHIDCPIHKGELLTGSFLFTDTEQVTGYDGFYDLHVKVKDMAGHDLMCIDVKVNILPPDDY